jgi:hypothetical protein
MGLCVPFAAGGVSLAVLRLFLLLVTPACSRAQTISSWFALNCYSVRAVPSHREIQQALVDIGDQKPSIVGSSQWIGSQEVGFVLNHLFGVDCRFIYVPSGAELGDHARALCHHFDTEGTPVMMGQCSSCIHLFLCSVCALLHVRCVM